MTRPAAPHDPQPPSVVIVEDDDAVRAALELTLELKGFRVTTCGSGEALLELDLPAGGACLLVDQRLPGLSGLEVLARLRSRGVHLPAVLVTSHPSPRLRAAAAAAGAPIVEKPLIGDAYVAAIREALSEEASAP